MYARTRFIASLCGLTLCCARTEPTKQDHADPNAPGRELDPGHAAASPPPSASNAAVSAAERVTHLGGPIADDMGRKFEGRLQLEVRGAGDPIRLTYASRGERSRVQVERPGSGKEAFDLILAGDQALVLRNGLKQYVAHDLDKLPEREENEPEIQIERSGERRMVSDLACVPWRLTNGSQRVDACVRGLPGKLDTDKLESLAGFDIPSWVEKVIQEGYLPVTATVSEGGRELYRVEIVRYTPQQVPENELMVPDNYRELKNPAAVR